VTIFLLQVGLFWILPGTSSAALLAVLSFIILMCYGGGFGTMPAFTADYFGSKNVGPIYGLMLTAWGTASAFGPLLIAHMRQSSGSYASGLHMIACIVALSMILPILVSPPKSVRKSEMDSTSLPPSSSQDGLVSRGDNKSKSRAA
jgi:OFA family oxalate/formate antiporter-like MFS transporter